MINMGLFISHIKHSSGLYCGTDITIFRNAKLYEINKFIYLVKICHGFGVVHHT